MTADIVSYVYSAAVALGGIMGYVKKGSLMSGLMGVGFGGLAAFGAYQTSNDPKNYMVSLAVSTTLAGVMGTRAVKSGKFMPAGLVAILSLAMVARFGYRYYSEKFAVKSQ